MESKTSDLDNFDLFVSKMLYIFKIKVCMTSYDVIMGNMEALVTLVFFKIKSSNLASWGILKQIFQKVIYFQIESFYDVSMTS